MLPPSQLFNEEYFPARENATIKSGKYKIFRKLGEGQSSSVWLVLNSSEEPSYQYVAVKILTLDATRRHLSGQRTELDVLKRIADEKGILSTNLPYLLDHFFEQGPGGAHLCLVTNLFANCISAIRLSAPRKALPIHFIQSVLAMVLDALCKLRTLRIVHTQVTLQNLLIKNWEASGDGSIAGHLKENPIEYDGEYTLANGESYRSPKVQPFSSEFSWETNGYDIELMTLCLVNFGQAAIIGGQPSTVYSGSGDLALRAPETILQSGFDMGIDVWAVGCLAFELLVGRPLFHPEANQTWTAEDDLLAKIMQLTGLKFPESMLKRAGRRNEFFDDRGNLLRVPDLGVTNLEDVILNCKMGIPDEEVSLAADFIRACLRFEHTERATPATLEVHPFIVNACLCCPLRTIWKAPRA